MSQTQTRRSSQVDLLHGPILKSLLLFALPIMASRVFQQIYNTMDTLIVGYTLGDSSIAAMGACSSIYEMMTGFTFGVGNGLAIVTARCFGRQETDRMKKSVASCIVIGVAVTLVVTILATIFMHPLLRLLKTGLVDLDRDSQCALENYAYTWPLHAQDWREPFTRNPEGYTDRMSEQSQQDLQRAEEARSFLVPRVQKFMDRARNADTATLTAQIYYFLQSLGAEEALQKLTDGLRACGDLPNADEALREWNVITELLDQMVHLLPAGEPITPADYDDLFTLLLRTTDMGHCLLYTSPSPRDRG